MPIKLVQIARSLSLCLPEFPKTAPKFHQPCASWLNPKSATGLRKKIWGGISCAPVTPASCDALLATHSACAHLLGEHHDVVNISGGRVVLAD